MAKVIAITGQPIVSANTGASDNHYAEIGDTVTLAINAVVYGTDSEGDDHVATYQWQRKEGVFDTETEVTEIVFVDVAGADEATLDIVVDTASYETPYRCVVGVAVGYHEEYSNSIAIKRDPANGPIVGGNLYGIKAAVGDKFSQRVSVTKNTGGRYHSYLCQTSAESESNPTGRVSTGNVAVGNKTISVTATLADAGQAADDYSIEVHDQYGSSQSEIFAVAVEDYDRTITVGQSIVNDQFGYFNAAGGDNPAANGSAIDAGNWLSDIPCKINAIAAAAVGDEVYMYGTYLDGSLYPGLNPMWGETGNGQNGLETITLLADTGETVDLAWTGNDYSGTDTAFAALINGGLGDDIVISFS